MGLDTRALVMAVRLDPSALHVVRLDARALVKLVRLYPSASQVVRPDPSAFRL